MSLGDHPRSRGVYVHVPTFVPDVSGSSPLARGLQHRVRRLELVPGIIPARAGFTRGGQRVVRSGADHPRSRGVYSEFNPVSRQTNGSSPLARGLLSVPIVIQSNHGIIPARAGFTRQACRRLHAVRDHPRSRGVYSALGRAALAVVGSSPLARGLRPGKVVST